MGALATGVFIATLIQNKKQNIRIASLEEKQIDAKYRPNLFVSSYFDNVAGDNSVSFTLENNGEDVEIIVFNCSFIDKRNICLPIVIEKGKEYVFALKPGATCFPEAFAMELTVQDKLKRLYLVPIKIAFC